MGCIPPRPSQARAQLTLHDADQITGTDDTLYSLFHEYYRGYTIYSTPEGRCCIHRKGGCIKLGGKFACFPDIKQAKTLIKRFHAQAVTSHAARLVSVEAGGEDDHIFPSCEE